MSLSEIQKERNEQCRERHELAVNRIRSMVTEETVEKAYVGYFQDVALFLLELENTRRKVASGEWGNYTLEQMRSLNEILYSDILDKNYERSYANPEYAVSSFGTEMGQLLSLLYAELRGGIHYAFEEKTDYLTILYELFIGVYNCFENAALEEASEQMKKKAEQPGQRSRFHPQNRSGRSYTGMPVITAMYFLQTGFWSRSIRPFLLRQI